jgi:hypothetical protein
MPLWLLISLLIFAGWIAGAISFWAMCALGAREDRLLEESKVYPFQSEPGKLLYFVPKPWDWTCPKTGNRCYCDPAVNDICPPRREVSLYDSRDKQWADEFRPHGEDEDDAS